MKPDPAHATVAEAAILTGKSKSRIYQLIDSEAIDVEETTVGIQVRMAQLRRVLESTVRGRPKGKSKHS
ncbi:hypothetical protein BH09ACT9_BH09ACT9_00510 [soil metagenome]